MVCRLTGNRRHSLPRTFHDDGITDVSEIYLAQTVPDRGAEWQSENIQLTYCPSEVRRLSSSPVLDTVSGYATAIDDPLPALFWMCVVTQWTLAVYMPVMPINYAWSVSLHSSSSRSHRRQRYHISLLETQDYVVMIRSSSWAILTGHDHQAVRHPDWLFDIPSKSSR